LISRQQRDTSGDFDLDFFMHGSISGLEFRLKVTPKLISDSPSSTFRTPGTFRKWNIASQNHFNDMLHGVVFPDNKGGDSSLVSRAEKTLLLGAFEHSMVRMRWHLPGLLHFGLRMEMGGSQGNATDRERQLGYMCTKRISA
jgi:hypothetical protein